MKKLPFHYGIIIIATGTLCIAAALGFGRFGLGMLLPSMGKALNWNKFEMGCISAGNFTGYLLAVLFCGVIVKKIGSRNLIFIALLTSGISMLALSVSNEFIYAIVLYSITGAGSGAANVPIMALTASWFTDRIRGKAAGYIVIGSGFAIVFSGFIIPFVNKNFIENGWRINWQILGVIVILIGIVSRIIIRDKPEMLGLKPMDSNKYKSLPQKTSVENKKNFCQNKIINIYKSVTIYHLALLYFIFGLTYSIYATFIVTVMVEEHNFTEYIAGQFWAITGFLSLFSGPVFGILSDRAGRRTAFIFVFFIQTLSYISAAAATNNLLLYLSVFCFGITAWSIPCIMSAAVSDYIGTEKMAAAFGFITFIFGIGQITGPALAGFYADKTGTMSGIFYFSSLLTAIAGIFAWKLKSKLCS